MKIIKIDAFENGGHDNQTINGVFERIPDGWAVIPDDMVIPETFPFVNIVVEGDTVVEMTAGVVPEPDPEPLPEPTEMEQLRADVDYLAIMTGVDL